MDSAFKSPANLGEMAKPFSASLMAGSNRSAQGSLPCSCCAISSMATTPGTPTAVPPAAACMNFMRLPPAMNIFGSAERGAISRPS